MRFIPKTSYSIHSRLSPQEVQSRMEKNVGDYWDFSGSEPFTGAVEGDTFRISPRLRYRNSFNPVLHGAIHASGTGSIVKVDARLHRFVLIFSIIWLGMACRFMAAGISLAVQEGSLSLVCISAIFLVAYLLLVGISFRHEHLSAKKRLYALLAEQNRP